MIMVLCESEGSKYTPRPDVIVGARDSLFLRRRRMGWYEVAVVES